MALDIASSFGIWPREAHVSSLTPVPSQKEQDEQIESKDGDQWHLLLERPVEPVFNANRQMQRVEYIFSHQKENACSQEQSTFVDVCRVRLCHLTHGGDMEGVFLCGGCVVQDAGAGLVIDQSKRYG